EVATLRVRHRTRHRRRAPTPRSDATGVRRQDRNARGGLRTARVHREWARLSGERLLGSYLPDRPEQPDVRGERPTLDRTPGKVRWRRAQGEQLVFLGLQVAECRKERQVDEDVDGRAKPDVEEREWLR